MTRLPGQSGVRFVLVTNSRILTTIGWMKSVGHCSYSTVETWMDDVLQVPVSRGYLAKLCTGIISDSLKEIYEELTDAIPKQDV